MFCSSKLSSTNLFTLQCMEKKEAVGVTNTKEKLIVSDFALCVKWKTHFLEKWQTERHSGRLKKQCVQIQLDNLLFVIFQYAQKPRNTNILLFI